MKEVFDVLIVGAGPAGGTCAFNSAKLGLKTLLIEEHKTIGEPVHCGECLSDLALNNLGLKLPNSVVALPVKGVRVIFPNNKSTYVNEKGYVLEKHLFEQWIAKIAEKEGAKIELDTPLIDLKRENNEWIVSSKEGKQFKAKILIDASGVSQIVSRKLELNEKGKIVTGIQYELKDIPTDGYLDFYIWPKLAPYGYLWMIPKNNGRANVGLVTDQIPKAKKFLDEFVKQMNWEKKVLVKTFGGPIPCSGPLKNTFAEGLMLIGDAAGFTSPLFEGGSHIGMKSGLFAAQIAKQAIEKNDFSKEMLAKYKNLWSNEFPPYDKIVKGKDALYSFTEDELNVIANALPEDLTAIGYTGKAGVALKTITANPALIAKGMYTAMKAFEYSRAKFYGW